MIRRALHRRERLPRVESARRAGRGVVRTVGPPIAGRRRAQAGCAAGRGRSWGIGPPPGRWSVAPPGAGGRLLPRVSRASACVGVRGRLAPARFARLIARGRARRRTHVSRPLPPGFAASDAALCAKKEKAAPETTSLYQHCSTLFLQSSPSAGQSGNSPKLFV